MNNILGSLPKIPSWDLNKSRYEELNELPLMASIGPVLIILAIYLVFVLQIGPAFMRKRDAYKLTNTLTMYNALQVVLSTYLVFRYTYDLANMGLFPRYCHINEDFWRHRILFGTYLYFTAKLTELLDTVFFVLRKKDNQITFLHVYHHFSMVIITWTLLKYWPSHTLVFIGFLNSLIHVFMYTYYGLAGLGPHMSKYLTWKKYMTKMQLIQFVTIIIQYVASVNISECPPSRGVATFVACNTGVILLLFLNFYRKSYQMKRLGKTASLTLCMHKEQ